MIGSYERHSPLLNLASCGQCLQRGSQEQVRLKCGWFCAVSEGPLSLTKRCTREQATGRAGECVEF